MSLTPSPAEALPANVLEALRASLHTPPSAARALPAACYKDPAVHDLEQQLIFGHDWIPLAHVSQLPKPGDFVTVDVGDEPLIVTRGKDGHIRVLSRICQHRGVDMLPNHAARHCGQGNTPLLRCPYHLWNYDLTGQLIAAPEMAGSTCHAMEKVKLPEFRSEIAEGFIFVTFKASSPPLASLMHTLSSGYLAKYGLGDAEVVWSRHWECDFNWKVLAENFMEPYHHLGAHRTTLQPFLPARFCVTEPGADEHHMAVRLPLEAGIRARIQQTGQAEPGFTPFPSLTLADHLDWWVTMAFPAFLLFLAPDRAFWYRLLPTGPETCSLLTTMLLHPAAKAAPDYAEQLARAEAEAIAFHLEDMQICSAIQRGVRGRGYTRGALSPLEEPLLHIQRYLARRLAPPAHTPVLSMTA